MSCIMLLSVSFESLLVLSDVLVSLCAFSINICIASNLQQLLHGICLSVFA